MITSDQTDIITKSFIQTTVIELMITLTVITISGFYCILILQDRYNREYFENLRKCYAPDHIPISPSVLERSR
jgi:hypothetical protein